MSKNPNHVDLGAWRKAHARNPIIVRPLRFLRTKLEIGRDPKTGAAIMHPAFRLAERAAKDGRGRALQLLAQSVNVHGLNGATLAAWAAAK